MPANGAEDPFWRDKARLKAEYEKHGSLSAVAVAWGVADRNLQRWWKRHGLPPVLFGGRPQKPAASEADDSWLLDLLKRHGDAATVELLADEAECPPKRVREALERLGKAGFRVSEAEAAIVLERVPPARDNLHPALFEGEHVRVGVVSDTHLGAKEEALAELELAYDVMAEAGVTQVWHPGDISCGIEVFGKKQHSEANVHTLDEAVAYVVDHYPRREGITTRLIGGNHDLEGAAGRAGFDIAQAVANQREDIDYLGPFEAWLETRPGTGRWIHMLHPKGSMSYAYSYKAQKLVDSYPSARKPALLILGHWHVMGNIRARDVEVVWAGCFEWQSQFMARLGLQPAVGFHIFDMTVGDDGSIVRFAPTRFPYFPGRKVAA